MANSDGLVGVKQFSPFFQIDIYINPVDWKAHYIDGLAVEFDDGLTVILADNPVSVHSGCPSLVEYLVDPKSQK